MGRRKIDPVWIVVICVAVGIAAIAFYYMSPGQAARRAERRRETTAAQRFVARFDSLCDVRLYPAVWRSGAFTKTEFDTDCKVWTLTISAEDWNRRTEMSKTDLTTKLFVNFAGARAQAGQDDQDLALVIKDDNGEKVASSTSADGTVIYR
jgi:hypothetical protein